MADDLAALRRRQKEDRLRKREQERQKRRREAVDRCVDNDEDKEGSQLNFNVTRKRNNFNRQRESCKNDSNETQSTSEAARRKRVQRLREEKKTEEALRLIKKMYPDTMQEVSTNCYSHNAARNRRKISEHSTTQGKSKKRVNSIETAPKSSIHLTPSSSPSSVEETLSNANPMINGQYLDNRKVPSTVKRINNISNSSTNIHTKLKTSKKTPLHHQLTSSLDRSNSWMSAKRSKSSHVASEKSIINESFGFSMMINLDSPPKPLSTSQTLPSSTESSKTNNASFSSKAMNRSNCQKQLFQPNNSLKNESFLQINKYNESSSDEDLLSIAQQIQTNKNRKQNNQKERIKNALKDNLIASAKKLHYSKSPSSNGDEEDLLFSARTLPQNNRNFSTRFSSPNSRKSIPNKKDRNACFVSTSKPNKGIRFSQLSDLDDSSDEDLVNQSYIIAENMKIQQAKNKASKSANNPIVLRRRQEERNHLNKSFESKITLIKEAPTYNDTSIWTDSDDEQHRNDKKKVEQRKKNVKKSHETLSNPKSFMAQQNHDEESEDEDDHNHLKPNFTNPKLGPPSALEPFILQNSLDEIYDSDDDERITTKNKFPPQHQIPASINRYLKDYQRKGVMFLYSLVSQRKGAILGDDMGLGKTVQIISLIAALQMKTGTKRDFYEIRERQKKISQDLIKVQDETEQALLKGTISICKSLRTSKVTRSVFSPIIIVVPPSIIDNFLNEFNTWGHFAVSVFQGKDRMQALEKVRNGFNDILIIGRSLLSVDSTIDAIKQIPWKLLVVDEFHEYKNAKSRSYAALSKIQKCSKCPIIGMTGTVMPNEQKELYVLVNLVQSGLLGDAKSFNKHFSIPMKLARTKDAKDDVLRLGKRRRDELDRALKGVYLKRNKVDVLSDTLTEKKETVIICALSDIQKELYNRVLKLPDYILLRLSNSPCDCGVNQNFFIGYKKMRTRKEQIEYQRRHKGDLVVRKKCCYRIPLNQNISGSNSDTIDPKAVLWRSSHPNHQECEKCPSCILLPALQKLYKICSHASLLQAGKDPDRLKYGTKEWSKFKTEVDFAKAIMTPSIVSCLPGKSYIREDSIMDDHLALSGKMQALDRCLQLFYQNRDKALIFSYSTNTLDLIQHYVRSKGYSFLRLDGSTATRKRQTMIDKFQESSDIFLFLISTKAGGLGLNLTAANKVIIYDVNWNPSHDSQAQDRSFRIGQLRNVDVIRLVARGTVEELIYARQIYKVHLTKDTLEGTCSKETSKPARIFRGVDKDPNRKGELFGSENLLKFKDGSFLAEMWKSSDRSNNNLTNSKHEEVSALAVVDALSKLTENEIENLGENIYEAKKVESQRLNTNHFIEQNNGQDIDMSSSDKIQSSEQRLPELDMSCVLNHDDFLRADRGQAALRPGDDGFEEEMGGASQMVHVTCALACENIKSELEEAESNALFKRKRNMNLSQFHQHSRNTEQLRGEGERSDSLSELSHNGAYSGKMKTDKCRGEIPVRLESVSERMHSKKCKSLDLMGSTVINTFSETETKVSTSHPIYIPSYLRN